MQSRGEGCWGCRQKQNLFREEKIMGFFKKLVLAAGAVALAPIAAPVAAAAGAAALGAAAAAGTAAAGAAAAAGTALAGAAAATGTAIAGVAGAAAAGVTAAGTAAAGAAAAAGTAVAGAVGTAAGTVAAAGTAAVGAVGTAAGTAAGAISTAVGGSGVLTGTAARFIGKEVGKKYLCAAGTAVLGTVVYQTGKDSGYEEGHREGCKSGFKDGYKKGRIDTAKKFNETVEQHINRVASFYGLAVCIGNLDGAFDEEDQQAVIEVLGDPKLQEEYVQKELSEVFQTRPNLEKIKERYLDKLPPDDLKELDEVIRAVIYSDGVVDDNEKNFYDNQWQPYLNSKTN